MTSSAESRLVVFRANGGPEVGAGHMTRCYALALAMMERGWRCAFVGTPEILSCGPDLSSDGIEVVVETDTSCTSMSQHWPDGCDLLVFDHYGVDCEGELPCRIWARRILVIDDLVERSHDCDVLVDPTLGRAPHDYEALTPPHCAVFCGPQFAPLRPEFSAARALDPQCRDERRVLVSFGATDPKNVTLKVLRALQNADLEIDVVLGKEAPHLDCIRAAIAGSSASIKLYAGVSAASVVDLMVRARLAVAAGGSGAWERCTLGLPSILITVADNQRPIAAALKNTGAALSLGSIGDVDEETISQTVESLLAEPARLTIMERAARSICDAQGATRLAMLLTGQKSSLGATVTLRPAAAVDSERILGWQRVPSTREYSHNPEPPTREQHTAWFANQRQRADNGLLVIEADGLPAGTLRLDAADERLGPLQLLVSILIGPDWRGQGIAATALDVAHRIWPEFAFLASVRPGNNASHHLFASAGYQMQDGEINYRRPPMIGSGARS